MEVRVKTRTGIVRQLPETVSSPAANLAPD
jgi:hypothetical protein